ncbi:MAG TPA: HAMP domain-containing sensor histidine kinase [Streptosporangiaceae bacterium]|nr:HAMP domain-containing sensor histidine kinase [Streptosporangiaceae bacterium]
MSAPGAASQPAAGVTAGRDAAGGGRSTRRLSLRARMLVLLTAVTTMFLLIMGTVSTVILARNVTQQFRGNLIAESAISPAEIASNPHGYAAVLITRLPLRVQPLTGTSGLTIELAGEVSRQLGTSQLRYRARLRKTPSEPFALSIPGGPRLLAVARLVTRSQSGTPGVLIVAQATSAATRQVRGFIIAELITGGALIALLAIGGEWLIGRGLEPLGQMAGTAHDITTRGDLTARMPDAGEQTEVGLLASAINTMLDRIQQAFGARLRSEQKVREFAADASHELRTPLTTIRGYAELYRQGALGPDQLPNAMRRIEQEAQRMSTLVAELLELARLDRTSSLDLAETDLAAVVRDAVADAVAVEPQRPVRAEAPPRLVAVVDEKRIRQVLANLLANVRAHTPVSAPVAVRLGAITGGILVEVADSGPGMSAEDAARAFDRFHRAADCEDSDPAPEPGHGSGPDAGRSGSGLGLSIVQAIAHAHGGRATLESWPGHGTTVRVWLPDRTA